MRKNTNVFLIVLMLDFLLLSACAQRRPGASGKKELPVAGHITKADTGHAVIHFDVYQHDFGKMIEGDEVSCTFHFTNAGTGNLLINSASASCGCTIPKYSKKPVKPGDGGDMEVVFNSLGKTGVQHKTIAVRANTKPPVTLLTITAEVTPENN